MVTVPRFPATVTHVDGHLLEDAGNQEGKSKKAKQDSDQE